MAPAATAQINVCIDRDHKEDGVRLALHAEASLADATSSRVDALERFDRSWEDFAVRFGLDLSSFTPMTDEEMREARYDYLLEKYGE